MGSCATKCCATKSSSGETPEIANKSSSGETLVFADNTYHFRIPALLYLKESNTFLAFAEKRTSPNDADAKNLVMSKGTRLTDGSLQWSPTEDLMAATKPDYRTMSPCPVFERNKEKEKEKLYLFFICIEGNTKEDDLVKGQTRLCYVTSTDCGETWSDLTDLTSSVMDSSFPNYQTFAVGPGHGIQLSSGTLLVPAYVRVKSGESFKSNSVVLRREDQNTWKAGQPIAVESGECQLAEVCDGKVYLNARSTGILRVEALSDDGKSFEQLSKSKLTLKERPHGCQGSVLGFPARELPAGEGGSSETALLFSHPTVGVQWQRLDLGVYLRKSLQDNDPWGKPLTIHPGLSGYSDLTYCEEEGHFGCLMERMSQRHQIAFREFDLKEIV